MNNFTRLPSKKIESHSSFLTNKSVNMFKMQIDILGLSASNSMRFQDINSFFNAVEQWYIGLKDILEEEYFKQIESKRVLYFRLRELVETDTRFQNKKTLYLMLATTKQFYSLIISGLQKSEFFFRIGSRNVKGLSRMEFFGDTIFGANKDANNERQIEEKLGQA